MEIAAALHIFRQELLPYVEFNEAEWIAFTQHLKFNLLKKKHYFTEYGKVCDKVGFIVSGAVRYFYMKDGEEITSYFSFANDYTTSYKSYVTRQPGFTYVQALEDTHLITFTRSDMEQMLADPLLAYKMERYGRLLAEHYLCCYEDRVATFVTQTPEERYMQLLQTGKDILQRIPQNYIAHYLGITPVSLSRIRRRVMEMAR